jgi:hypothetical protein
MSCRSTGRSVEIIRDGLQVLPSLSTDLPSDRSCEDACGPLGRFAVTDEEVIAERAIGMRQTAGQRIDAGGVSIGLFGHPAAGFAMHEAAPVADQEDLRLGSGHDEPFFHESESHANGQPRPVARIPSTTTTATHEQLHGHAVMQIDRGLGPQGAITSPAPLSLLFLFHSPP